MENQIKRTLREPVGFTLLEIIIIIFILGILATLGTLKVHDVIFTKTYQIDVDRANSILTTAVYFALFDGYDIEGDMFGALGLEVISEGLFTINASNTPYIEEWSPNVIIDPNYREGEFFLLRVRNITDGNTETNILAKRRWSLDNDDD